MNTRIKVVEMNNGDVIYVPQWKGWIFWKYFYHAHTFYPETVMTFNLDEAKKVIDDYLAKVEREKKEALEKRELAIKKTSIIKYP